MLFISSAESAIWAETRKAVAVRLVTACDGRSACMYRVVC